MSSKSLCKLLHIDGLVGQCKQAIQKTGKCRPTSVVSPTVEIGDEPRTRGRHPSRFCVNALDAGRSRPANMPSHRKWTDASSGDKETPAPKP